MLWYSDFASVVFLLGTSVAVLDLMNEPRETKPTKREIPRPRDFRGISDVDPEQISQVVEALDPEATEAAHTSIKEQREKLPK